MKRWQLALAGAGAAAVGFAWWQREELGARLRMLGVDIETGVLPDRALFPYQPLPYARLARKLEDKGSWLYKQSVPPGTILGAVPIPSGGMPVLAFLDAAAAAAKVNPAWVFVRIQAEQSGWTITDESAATLAKTPKTWSENGVPQSGTALSYKLRWLLGYGRMEASDLPQFAGWPQQIYYANLGTRKLVDAQTGLVGQPIPIDCKTWKPMTGCQMVVPVTIADRVALKYTPHRQALLDTRRLFEIWFPEYASS